MERYHSVGSTSSSTHGERYQVLDSMTTLSPRVNSNVAISPRAGQSIGQSSTVVSTTSSELDSSMEMVEGSPRRYFSSISPRGTSEYKSIKAGAIQSMNEYSHRLSSGPYQVYSSTGIVGPEVNPTPPSPQGQGVHRHASGATSPRSSGSPWNQ